VKGTRGRKGAFAGAWRLGLDRFFSIAVALGDVGPLVGFAPAPRAAQER
jgi:hypothetical protein